MSLEQMVGEARARHPQRLTRRERLIVGLSSVCYLGVALGIATQLPSERATDPILVAAIVIGYAVASRVRFEFGNWYVVPEQLLFVPLLLLAPLPLVPVLVSTAAVISLLPEFIAGSWHRERALGSFCDSWFAVGPVLVLAWLAPGDPELKFIGAYVAALAAQLLFDFAWTLIRDRLIDGMQYRTIVNNYIGVARFDAILAPVALAITITAAEQPWMLIAIGPLVWLLEILSRDRRERYAAALELQRAYRGTVMLLTDVVEFDDAYTADHSRSVVDLVNAVSDRLGIEGARRQELEFAALLHDVGKIAIPKEILNKPAALTTQEFELMKTHTIEGQFMLDRVGGLLARVGEIVRSCHERWDGGGYPDGLRGEQIPIEARIVFACDAYNAITTDRPYRAAKPPAYALEELARGAGSQFDPEIVAVLTEVVSEGEPSAPAADAVRALLARSSVAEGVGVSA
ncbi:MAG TPA: HD-GYP domain-containing protein [Thermoleophilaceae bacterium]